MGLERFPKYRQSFLEVLGLQKCWDFKTHVRGTCRNAIFLRVFFFGDTDLRQFGRAEWSGLNESCKHCRSRAVVPGLEADCFLLTWVCCCRNTSTAQPGTYWAAVHKHIHVHLQKELDGICRRNWMATTVCFETLHVAEVIINEWQQNSRCFWCSSHFTQIGAKGDEKWVSEWKKIWHIPRQPRN